MRSGLGNKMRRVIMGLLVGVSLCGVGCQPPPAKAPVDFDGPVQVFPVSGHKGLLIFDPPIHFGPFSTTQVSRGMFESDKRPAFGILPDEHIEQHKVSTFAIAGWRGQCDDYLIRTTEHEIKGVGVGSNGVHIVERPKSQTEHAFACDLRGPAGHVLRGDLAQDGANVDAEDGKTHYVVQEWNDSPHHGYIIERWGGDPLAAVELDYDGYVYWPTTVPEADRAPVLALLVALLLR
jgi:hypothetical protein